jgi:hypothetical protein
VPGGYSTRPAASKPSPSGVKGGEPSIISKRWKQPYCCPSDIPTAVIKQHALNTSVTAVLFQQGRAGL